jgi:hypothetical protein
MALMAYRRKRIMADYLAVARRVLATLPVPAKVTESALLGQHRQENKPALDIAEHSKTAISQRQETVKQQVSRWLGARCTRSQRAWGAEKFLYRDYREWCQQFSQAAIPLEQFAGILDESFAREVNGWQGLCLAMDWATSNGPGSKPCHPLPLASERAQ